MSNSAFTGFLVKKTIQEFPVRGELNYYDDYQKQNLILYIKKKLADLKLSNPEDLNAKRIANLKIKGSQSQKISPQKVTINRNISQRTVTRKPRKPPAPAPEQQVAQMLSNVLLKKNATSNLFSEYKLANLKANLIKLQTQKDYDLSELNYIEFNDDEQIQYFLNQLQKAHPDLDVATLLNVKVDRKVTAISQDNIKELIEKRLNREELERVLKSDMESQQQQIINVYKESRYDQFEPQYKRKDKIRMSMFAKRQQIQEKMFADLLSDEIHTKKEEVDQHQFIRSVHKDYSTKKYQGYASPFSSKMVSQRNSVFLNTRAQTSQQTFFQKSQQTFFQKSQQTKEEHQIQHDMNDILEKCDKLEKEQKKDKRIMKKKLKFLNKEIKKTERAFSASQQAQSEQKSHHEGFVRFQSENLFKKKLINYLLDQVPNKGDVISQKARQNKTAQFIRRLSN